MTVVRAFPVRIKFLTLKPEFVDLFNSCQRIINPFFEFFELIRKNKTIQKILWMVLYIGNYVNQGTIRGNAAGFELDYLTALKPLKGTEPDSNMLSFLMETMEKEFPEMMEIITDMEFIKKAKTMDSKEVNSEIEALKRCHEQLKALKDEYMNFPFCHPRATAFVEESDSFLVPYKISPASKLLDNCSITPF